VGAVNLLVDIRERKKAETRQLKFVIGGHSAVASAMDLPRCPLL
jgi:hypothetical protein